MNRVFVLIAFMLFMAAAGFAPGTRPQITGLAFVRFEVTSLGPADNFYTHDLGLPRASNCWAASSRTCFFITPYQDVEIVRTDTPSASNRMDSFGLWTTDAEALRGYLLARGLHPGELTSQFKGEQEFEISDNEQHHVVFMSTKGTRDLLDDKAQVSHHMIHAGFVVHDRSTEDKFYKDVLDFHVYWHGGMKDSEDNWVDMQVPDGTDWIEYMLGVSPNATHKTLGVMNHIALGVPDIQAAKQQLVKNGWKPTEEPKIGRDGKWQLNLYDPDETRVELMEFEPTKEPCCSPYAGPHPEGPHQ
jgi:catechol 2,3-dioxygenase-like lactoylglutathione lyase family enzyme